MQLAPTSHSGPDDATQAEAQWLAALVSLGLGSCLGLAAGITGAGSSQAYGANVTTFVTGVLPAGFFGIKFAYGCRTIRWPHRLASSIAGACLAFAAFLVPPSLLPGTSAWDGHVLASVPILYLASATIGLGVGFAGAITFLPLMLLGFPAGVASAAYAVNRLERLWTRYATGAPSTVPYQATVANGAVIAFAFVLARSQIAGLTLLAPIVAGLGGMVEISMTPRSIRPRLPSIPAITTGLLPVTVAFALLACASPLWRMALLPLPGSSDLRPYPSLAMIAGMTIRLPSNVSGIEWGHGGWKPDRPDNAVVAVVLDGPGIRAFPGWIGSHQPLLTPISGRMQVVGDGERGAFEQPPAWRCSGDGIAPTGSIRVPERMKADIEGGYRGVPCGLALPRSSRVPEGYLVAFTSYPPPSGRETEETRTLRLEAGAAMCLIIDTSTDAEHVRSYWFLRGSCQSADTGKALATLRDAVAALRPNVP